MALHEQERRAWLMAKADLARLVMRQKSHRGRRKARVTAVAGGR